MDKYIATVTSNGQSTLPAEVQRRLGLVSGDRVAIIVDADPRRAELRRIEHDVESVRGLIPTPPHMAGLETGDFDDLIEEAMSDHADGFVRRMRAGEK